MSAVKRRRYRFPDRATAEAEADRRDRVAFLTRMVAEELIAGGVMWDYQNPYAAAPIRPDRADGGAVAVVFQPEGQRPSLTVYSPDELREWYRSLCVAGCSDDESRAVRDLLERTLRRLPY